MKVKEISIGKNRKVGLPNYSSVDIHAGITVIIEEGDDIEEVYRDLSDEVQREIDNELKPYGISDEIGEGHKSREVQEPSQNFPHYRGKKKR